MPAERLWAVAACLSSSASGRGRESGLCCRAIRGDGRHPVARRRAAASGVGAGIQSPLARTFLGFWIRVMSVLCLHSREVECGGHLADAVRGEEQGRSVGRRSGEHPVSGGAVGAGRNAEAKPGVRMRRAVQGRSIDSVWWPRECEAAWRGRAPAVLRRSRPDRPEGR